MSMFSTLQKLRVSSPAPVPPSSSRCERQTDRLQREPSPPLSLQPSCNPVLVASRLQRHPRPDEPLRPCPGLPDRTQPLHVLSYRLRPYSRLRRSETGSFFSECGANSIPIAHPALKPIRNVHPCCLSISTTSPEQNNNFFRVPPRLYRQPSRWAAY